MEAFAEPLVGQRRKVGLQRRFHSFSVSSLHRAAAPSQPLVALQTVAWPCLMSVSVSVCQCFVFVGVWLWL